MYTTRVAGFACSTSASLEEVLSFGTHVDELRGANIDVCPGAVIHCTRLDVQGDVASTCGVDFRQ